MLAQTDAARRTLARLITSFHILHRHNILNEAGTISIRNPSDPTTFITNNRSAISISSPSDLDEWYVDNESLEQRAVGDLSNPPAHHSNPEIYIHSCLYARYPGVQSIVHSSAVDFIVYGLCDAKASLSRAVFNRAGFLDDYNPTFDPTDALSGLPATHPQNLLIDHPVLGKALADSLIASTNGVADEQLMPEHGAVFIRGNGAVIWNGGLEEAVFKAVNLQRNATIQTTAMLQRADSELEIKYLTPTEALDCQRAMRETVLPAWGAWATEVSRLPWYRNDLSDFV